MRTAKDTFYFVEDVMKMLGLSRSKAYSIIKQFNTEMEEKGYGDYLALLQQENQQTTE